MKIWRPRAGCRSGEIEGVDADRPARADVWKTESKLNGDAEIGLGHHESGCGDQQPRQGSLCLNHSLVPSASLILGVRLTLMLLPDLRRGNVFMSPGLLATESTEAEGQMDIHL